MTALWALLVVGLVGVILAEAVRGAREIARNRRLDPRD